jgi:hypothetical protein
MLDLYLLPSGSRITAKGEGSAVDASECTSRVFLVTFAITEAVEQEAIELTIAGSIDGQNWAPAPLLTFPQQFYCGDTHLLLDLREPPQPRYLRAGWTVNRWGRGLEEPMFEISVRLREVPTEMLAQTSAAATI